MKTDTDLSILDQVTTAYLECAAWCELEYPDEPDKDPGGFDAIGVPVDSSSYYAIQERIKDHLAGYLETVIEYANTARPWSGPVDSFGATDYTIWECYGHDLYYTSAGHGTGFWDRGYPDALADALSDQARAFGTFPCWLSADGKVVFDV